MPTSHGGCGLAQDGTTTQQHDSSSTNTTNNGATTTTTKRCDRAGAYVYTVEVNASIVCCSGVRACCGSSCRCLPLLVGLQIRPHHHPSPSLRRTLATVLRIVHTELGFATTTDDNDDDDDTTLRTTTTYLLLAIPSRRIVGVVQTEPLQQAYRLHSSSSSRSRTPVPATLGVHLVWIHRTVRRQGYASLLIKHIIRSSCSTTITARPPRLAWSSPTPAGVALARHVAAAAKDNNHGRRGGGEADHHHPVLVYDVVERKGSTRKQQKNNDNRSKRPPRSSSSTD